MAFGLCSMYSTSYCTYHPQIFSPHRVVHQGQLFKMIFPLCLFLVLLTIDDLVQANTLVYDHDSMMERMKVLEVRDAIELKKKLKWKVNKRFSFCVVTTVDP